VTVALTVTSAPVQHSVLLSWKASTNSGIASYSMYRSTTPGGSYGLMASALGATSYSDQSVQSGATYYYVVTAVNDMGHESSYSNDTRVIIP
jgi:cellulose 1,4-beta-cellobiosidase